MFILLIISRRKKERKTKKIENYYCLLFVQQRYMKTFKFQLWKGFLFSWNMYMI